MKQLCASVCGTGGLGAGWFSGAWEKFQAAGGEGLNKIKPERLFSQRPRPLSRPKHCWHLASQHFLQKIFGTGFRRRVSPGIIGSFIRLFFAVFSMPVALVLGI